MHLFISIWIRRYCSTWKHSRIQRCWGLYFFCQGCWWLCDSSSGWHCSYTAPPTVYYVDGFIIKAKEIQELNQDHWYRALEGWVYAKCRHTKLKTNHDLVKWYAVLEKTQQMWFYYYLSCCPANIYCLWVRLQSCLRYYCPIICLHCLLYLLGWYWSS